MPDSHETPLWWDILIIVFFVISLPITASLLSYSNRRGCYGGGRIEVKSTITNLASALKMYQADQGSFPPDGEGNLSSTMLGGPNETVAATPANNQNVRSAYCDGTLVRYLDGDNANDTGTSPIFVGKKPISYFEFVEDQIATATAPLHLIDTAPFRNPFFL